MTLCETVAERDTGGTAVNCAARREEIAHMPHVPCRMEYPVEENPFESLGVDLTYRCNMSCTYCYNPIRSLADMDLSYFEEVCRRLPGCVPFKFLGGKPTLHPDFMGFILTGSGPRPGCRSPSSNSPQRGRPRVPNGASWWTGSSSSSPFSRTSCTTAKPSWRGSPAGRDKIVQKPPCTCQ